MFKTMATCIILNLIYVSTFLFLSFFDVKEVCFLAYLSVINFFFQNFQGEL